MSRNPPTAAATGRTATVYLRQSLDRTGEGAAVSRQLAEIRQFCEGKGWTIAEVFEDNDVSATSGKRRPGFEDLLASNPQCIVVWHIDRLLRLSKDLERVIELGVNVYAVKSGHIDLSNPAGRAVAKTVVAWAQYEGEQKGLRQVAANRQRAQQGRALWTRRPFGFARDHDGVHVVPTEASEIRSAADKVLNGATLASIAADLNRRSVRTTTGGAWTVTTLRRVLLNPRLTGRVISCGQDYGKQDLPSILQDDIGGRLQALLTDPRRKSSPSTATKYLLSGIVECGRLGCNNEVMFATTSAQKKLIYRCTRCYGGRSMERVDEVVRTAVLALLSRPDASDVFTTVVDVTRLREEVVSLRDRRDGLAALLADGLLSADAVRDQAQRLTSQIDVLERQIAGALGTSPVTQILSADDVAAAFDRLDLRAKREVIRTLMRVRILPVGKGVRFRPEHVELIPRASGSPA